MLYCCVMSLSCDLQVVMFSYTIPYVEFVDIQLYLEARFFLVAVCSGLVEQSYFNLQHLLLLSRNILLKYSAKHLLLGN